MDIWKRRCTIGNLLVIVVIVASLTAILYPKPNRNEYRPPHDSCSSHLKQLCLGIDIYSRDYDQKLPPAAKWCDAVRPYVKYEQKVFHCNQAPQKGSLLSILGLAKDSPSCNYSYLNKLNQVSMGKIRNPAGTPILFDSNGGWNSTLPVTGAVSRHSGGYNCGFVDGHVKWLKG